MCVCVRVVYTCVHDYKQYLAKLNVGVEQMHHLSVAGCRFWQAPDWHGATPALEEECTSVNGVSASTLFDDLFD